jgi:hypothetical protein
MPTVIAYFETNDRAAAQAARQIIVEGREFRIDKRYSARLDRAQHPGMQDHVHVQFKGRDVSIINRDGTSSHSTTRDDVPRYILDYLRQNKLIAEGKVQPLFGLSRKVVDVAVLRYRAQQIIARVVKILRAR